MTGRDTLSGSAETAAEVETDALACSGLGRST
jgi:hypothetical protein